MHATDSVLQLPQNSRKNFDEMLLAQSFVSNRTKNYFSYTNSSKYNISLLIFDVLTSTATFHP